MGKTILAIPDEKLAEFIQILLVGIDECETWYLSPEDPEYIGEDVLDSLKNWIDDTKEYANSHKRQGGRAK